LSLRGFPFVGSMFLPVRLPFLSPYSSPFNVL
jgi:hypothetical protein